MKTKHDNTIILLLVVAFLLIITGTFTSCEIDLEDAYIVSIDKQSYTTYPQGAPPRVHIAYVYEVDNPWGFNAYFTSSELLYQVGDHISSPVCKREEEE